MMMVMLNTKMKRSKAYMLVEWMCGLKRWGWDEGKNH